MPSTLAPSFLTLNVKGTSTINRRAERAVMSVSVQDIHNTTAALEKLLHQYTPKTETGEATLDAPVTHWSMPKISTHLYKANVRNVNSLPSGHEASAAFDIEFRDFVCLRKIATELSTMEFVRIKNISWRVTDATKESLKSLSRTAAVEDAILRAKDFAKPFGEKVPRAVELTEQGFTMKTESHMRARADRDYSDTRIAGIDFELENVQLGANVTVQFVVD